MEEKYEFDLQKIVGVNYTHFTLWQQHFRGAADSASALAATEFVLFCCLADKILDSGRFSMAQKDSVCEKLDSSRFFSTNPYESRAFPEMDSLLNHVRTHLADSHFSKQDTLLLKAHMQRAFDSEVFMCRHSLQEFDVVEDEELHLLTDKAVEFESLAFLLAGAAPISLQMEQAGACIGRLLWLIDDLWDLPEDVQACRRNSLLFLGQPCRPLSIGDRIAGAQARMTLYSNSLKEDLSWLQRSVSEELFLCICWELRKWSKYADTVLE